jgi:hypothetical protein
MTDTGTEQTQRPLRRRGRPVGTTKKTPAELAQNQLEASSRWYYKNHEYRCAQKKKYYAENRNRILEQRKQKQIGM